MSSGYGYGPFDADPVSGEEVPEGKVRDFLGELWDWQEWCSVSGEGGEILHQRAHTELCAGADGKVYLYIDSQENGHVAYIAARDGGFELAVSHGPDHHGKLFLR